MKMVVIGGSELIGRMLVSELRRDGHDVLAASPGEALAAAHVVIDLDGSNQLADEAAAGVAHHVLLSVVGADRVAQEEAVKAGPVPYTIVRITPLFEDVRVVEGPTVLAQPVAAADVASALADVAAGTPLDDTIELAGPEAFPVDAGCFGAVPDPDSLIPGDGARIAPTNFEDWLGQSSNTP